MQTGDKRPDPTQDPAACPGDQAFQMLGRRWNAFIIWALLERPRRFTDLREVIDGLSDRMLTKRLRELEDAGIISRRRYREVPPRVEYALTEAGRDLQPIIQAMEEWSSTWTNSLATPVVRETHTG
jgi:DNA-binding HxlR family transcriptional regulator